MAGKSPSLIRQPTLQGKKRPGWTLLLMDPEGPAASRLLYAIETRSRPSMMFGFCWWVGEVSYVHTD